MSAGFKLADSVSMRLVQIFQEAVLTGVDGADLLRQIRLQVDPDEPSVLVLTPAYRQQVAEMHAKLESQAQELQARMAPKPILGDGGSDDN
jgi:hypothetical protein